MTEKINLALQGGGAHGAYNWGVLDRLLEEEDLISNAISGTSAGAMNAAMLHLGGRTSTQDALGTFWKAVSTAGFFVNPTQSNFLDKFSHGWNLDGSFNYEMIEMLVHTFWTRLCVCIKV